MTSRKLFLSVAALALMATTPVLAADTGVSASGSLGTSVGVDADVNAKTAADANKTAPQSGTDVAASGDYSLTNLDANKNGSISREEFRFTGSSASSVFGNIDTNRDGKLTNAELQAYNNANIQQE